jgi:hypothetical protein
MRRLLLVVAGALAVSVVWAGVQPRPASAAAHRRHRHKKPSHIVVLAIGDRATLSDDGLSVDIPVTITCRDASPAPIHLTLQQNAVTGAGHSGTDYKCNHQAQRVVVPVNATSPFKKGSAMASVSVTLHTSTGGSSSTSHSGSVQLV